MGCLQTQAKFDAGLFMLCSQVSSNSHLSPEFQGEGDLHLMVHGQKLLDKKPTHGM
jgi:hypothetical protein